MHTLPSGNSQICQTHFLPRTLYNNWTWGRSFGLLYQFHIDHLTSSIQRLIYYVCHLRSLERLRKRRLSHMRLENWGLSSMHHLEIADFQVTWCPSASQAMRDIKGYKSKYGAVGHNKRTLSIATIDGRRLEQVTYWNYFALTRRNPIFVPILIGTFTFICLTLKISFILRGQTNHNISPQYIFSQSKFKQCPWSLSN